MSFIITYKVHLGGERNRFQETSTLKVCIEFIKTLSNGERFSTLYLFSNLFYCTFFLN